MSYTVEDPTEAEQMRADLDKAQEVIAGSTPLIPKSPDLFFDLPRGLRVGDRWEREVELREMTGLDEELLGRARPDDQFETILALGVARIGSVDLASKPLNERKDTLRRLLYGERNQLIVHIARVTYGDIKELSFTCDADKTEFSAEISLSRDIPVRKMEDPDRFLYTFVTSKGQEIEFRLVQGTDQDEINSKKGLTVGETNTLILSEVIQKVDGKPPVDKQGFARSLSMADRQKLLDQLVALQPDTDLVFTTVCPTCDSKVVVLLNWGNIFRP